MDLGTLKARYIATALLSVIAIWLFVASAWISDDALISLRQVFMFASGEGMVWNVGQRVQAFTHPLWFLILSAGYALSGSLYYMTMAVSGLCIAGVLALYWRFCAAHLAGGLLFLGMALPLSSTSFRDFMTSGLENPLSFLITALIITLVFKERSFRRDQMLWLCMALAILNRQDLALQFAPLALWLLFSDNFWQQIKAALIGGAVLALWFGFATFYFGAPLPNTYYAKLTAGVPSSFVSELSQIYLVWTSHFRPATMLVIAAGLIAAIKQDAPLRLLAVGVFVHLFYVASIGGDFMVGRFLSVDFLICCFILVKALSEVKVPRATGVLALLVLCGLVTERPFHMQNDFEDMALGQVVDERRLFYHTYGMMSEHRNWPELTVPQEGVEITHLHGLCGFAGAARLNWPDNVHVIDMCGLTDPFLSRLPIYYQQRKKMGHFKRAVPVAYARGLMDLESAEEMDPELSQLARDVELISKGPLFAPGRLVAIIRLNRNSYAIDEERFKEARADDAALISEIGWINGRPQGLPMLSVPSQEHEANFVGRFGLRPEAPKLW